MKKIGVISLGCPKNLVDTEVMLGLSKAAGFEVTAREDQAEILLINTCCFIKSAEDEALGEIAAAASKRANRELAGLIISGCLPERYGKKLSERFPDVDFFLGTGNFTQLPQLLKQLEQQTKPQKGPQPAPPASYLYDHNSARMLAAGPSVAYSKIAEGCSRTCSFCVIPKLRGRQRSRRLDSVVKEAGQFVDQGIMEMNLVAQDLTAYGSDLKPQANLAQLLGLLEKGATPPWIRLLYNYPECFSAELIGIIAGSKKIVPYLDLPLQHIHPRLLKAMRRQVTAEQIESLLVGLRQAIGELTLRTTLLVGFPGETEKEFLSLCDFVRQQKFERLGVFPYSLEKGTRAANLPGQIPEDEKISRAAEIMRIQAEVVAKKQCAALGKTLSVLVLGKSGRDDYPFYGRAASQAPDIDGLTFIQGKKGITPGTIVAARQSGFEEHDILASVFA